MPAVSRAQQIAMAVALHNPEKLYARNRGMLDMSQNQLGDFASTPRKNLPQYSETQKKMAKALAGRR